MMEKDIITVPVSNLVPGTIVARDVYTRNNQLLIPKDYVIDERVITRITLFGILSVPVYEDDVRMNQIDEDDLEDNIFTQQEKQEFLEFKKDYDLTTNVVSKNMNQLLKADGEINSDQLIEEVDKLVFK